MALSESHRASTPSPQRAMEVPKDSTGASTSLKSRQIVTRSSAAPLSAPAPPRTKRKRTSSAPAPAASDVPPDGSDRQSTDAPNAVEPSLAAGAVAPSSALAQRPGISALAPGAQALLLTLRAHESEDVCAALNLHCMDPSFMPGDKPPRVGSHAPDPTCGTDPS